MRVLKLVGLALVHGATAVYIWPDKYDALEDLIAMSSGYLRFGFSDLVIPCAHGSNQVGIQNSAEWVRTGFHDAITHDASTGTGGLDMSIMFELDRDENTGSAFNNTFNAMFDFVDSRCSAADVLALSVVAAVSSCGGPRIPLRFGRIDATEAGPAGVPKPEDDLQMTTDRFATAGFSQSDMISMVACGHSLGNIHSVDFPDLVAGEPTAANVATFDKTPASFDNAIATEYLSNTTSNPLVVGSNSTTNSDMRIFASDGNKTMSGLSDSNTFRDTCSDIFERMIDTVPATVKLSEPLELRDIKPYVNSIQLQSDGAIHVTGRIRVRTTAVTGRNPDDLSLSLPYLSRNGQASDAQVISTTKATLKGGQSIGFHSEVFNWFEFSQGVAADVGISSFTVSSLSPSQGNKTVYDNGGTGGYPITDKVLYQESSSCLTQVTGGFRLTVVAAVQKELVEAGATVSLDFIRKIPRGGGIVLPILNPETIAMTKLDKPEKSGYVYFQGEVTLADASWSTTFDISVKDGSAEYKVEYKKTNPLPRSCAALP